MKITEKTLFRQLIAGVLVFSILLAGAATSQAYTADTQILPAVITPSSDFATVGIKGDYVTDAQGAVDRINAIRLEACKEGVPNPNNPSVKLTIDDYIPIRWSYGLEMVARIRAAEASFLLGHTRPNGTNCFNLTSGEKFYYYAENLAWNFSSSMLYGVEQWYGEKKDWVNQNASAVTGHYTSMINPTINYVGLGCMLTDYGAYPNTTCARFGYSVSDLDTTMAKSVADCIQMIEVNKTYLTNAVLVEVSGNTGTKLKAGETMSYELVVVNGRSGAVVMDNVKWTSSNTKVATVDSYGTIKAVGAGTVKISAVSDSGLTAAVSLTVSGSSGKEKSGTSQTGSSVAAVKSLKAKAGSKKLTITWKKVSDAAGYQLQVSTKSSFKGAKTISLNKTKQKYVAKKLKAKKKYYVRIRAYKTYKDGNGKTQKSYGTWVKVSKKTK